MNIEDEIRNESQNKRILKFLETGATLTPQEAIMYFGCYRLAARIYDLHKLGHKVITEMQYKGRTRWARYRLICK